MNKTEILNMPASREMDKLIAEEVFHLEKTNVDGWYWQDGMYDELPYYSSDISDAWLVYKKLISDCKQNGGEPDFIMLNSYPDGTFYIAKIWAHHDGEILEFELTAETAPLAICRAALMDVKNDE